MAPKRKIQIRQLELRNRLWPKLSDEELWLRQKNHGFTTIPRTMPLLMSIMDDMAGGKPVSSTYLELWCRNFDDCFVVLSKQREMAFHSGFTGQRAERTWRERIRILAALGFIDIKEGPSGPESYALIWNPYKVIRKHHETGSQPVREDKYNALIARAVEIGATDLE